MTGGYLRTNFRRSGQNQLTALGGGYPLTSYAGGAGLTQPYGGVIMGSVVFNAASAVTVGAQSAMSAWFGNTYESGFAIKVIAINIIHQSAALNGFYASNSSSNITFIPINSAALGANITPSAEFEWVGLITSAPT